MNKKTLPTKKQKIYEPNRLKPAEERPREVLIKEDKSQFALTKTNYRIMIASAAFIVIGFLLMLGGGTTTEQFNPDIFSVRRIVIGPTLAFVGFVAMGVGIVYSSRKKKETVAPED